MEGQSHLNSDLGSGLMNPYHIGGASGSKTVAAVVGTDSSASNACLVVCVWSAGSVLQKKFFFFNAPTTAALILEKKELF